MPDQNRNQQQNRSPRKSSPNQQDPRRDPDMQRTTEDPESSTQAVADDRGRERDSGRRNFSHTRESDELDNELERETGIEEGDEEDIDSGRSDR